MSRRSLQAAMTTSRELAVASGVPLSTLRYYISLGLLPISSRAGNKHLFNSTEATSRLKKIIRLRQQGYTIALIRQQLSKEGAFSDRA